MLIDCDLDQVITARQSLFKALVPLAGNYDSTDRERTTSIVVKEEDHLPAVSSHDPSAESIADDSDDLEIRRMLLGTSGAALLRDHEEYSTPSIGSLRKAADPVDAAKDSNRMQIYFEYVMRKFLNDQQLRLPRSNPTSRPTPTLMCLG